ncbi:MAG: hypothetical protein RG741_10080 [Bacteroidales bacterium]|nr:hypothetical protein [Bacteroidales bacterium]
MMLNAEQSSDSRRIISLGLHSAAIIAFQLALMQLISIVQWHHFAYMIISVAMLGFGASGTLLALFREQLLRRAVWLVPLLMTTAGFFMSIAFELTRLGFFRFDVYLLFIDRSQFPVLAANYLIFFVPFFTGALAIGILFIRHARQIGTYYFSNLLGSGVGGILVLLLLGKVFPQQIPPIIGLLSVAAGLISLSPEKRKLQLGAAAMATMTAAIMIVAPGDIVLSEYKGLARTMNLPDATIVYRQPGTHGLTEVATSPALRFAPALSLRFSGEVPVKKNVFVNADHFGVIPHAVNSRERHILDHTTQAMPWRMRDRDRVLMLNAGEGAPLAHAFTQNPLHVDAVIANRDVVNMMKTGFVEETGGLFLHEDLSIHTVEARNFLASRKPQNYDLILLPQQYAFGGTAGINALRENYSMTLEAFMLMWDHLEPDGVIAVTTWLDYPSRVSLKLLATLVETAVNKGVEEPKQHIAAVRSWGNITFVLKKSPITAAEIENIRAFCEELFFDPLLLPGITEEVRQRYNMLGDTGLLYYVDSILRGDTQVIGDYSFMISPATDNKPYFSQFLKLGRLRELSDVFGGDQLPFLELGYLIVLVTLAQSALLALIFIILPLLRLRKSHRRKTGTLLYFGALGIGYMFVEIILIQRFVLYFGQPVYALSAVISTMLIASGAGSLLSGRLPATPRMPAIFGIIITALLMAYTLFLTPVLQWTIAFPLAVKILISLLLIGIPSFFKGFMFPLGIRFLSGYDAGQVPWAWGINGSVSVISTSLAMLLAVEAGFQTVMGVAVLCYTVAFLTFILHRLLFRTADVL